jgi:hypothetical protein
LGRPSHKKIEEILKLNLITNCPFTVEDAKPALLYGPDVATTKGKNTCGKPTPHVPTFLTAPTIFEHQNVLTSILFKDMPS